MLTLNEYMQNNQDFIMEDLESKIEDMNLPKEYENRILEILEDNVFDILEYRYEQEYSAYCDDRYEELRDAKN